MHVPRRHEDEALGRLVGTARELDLVARLDDGTLAVVLARIAEPGASEAAERLRAGIRTSATAGVAVWRRGDTAADVVARAEQLLDAATQLGGNHTRGPKQDVLVYGHPRLGVTAFSQLSSSPPPSTPATGSRRRTPGRSRASPVTSRWSSS